MERSSADYTGMMATVINSLILQNSLEQKGIQTRVLSAIKMDTVCEAYIRRRAIRHIEKNRVAPIKIIIGNINFPAFINLSLILILVKVDKELHQIPNLYLL